MTIYDACYSSAIVLDSSQCKFENCIFHKAEVNGNLVEVNNANLNCSFVSCFFFQINLGTESHRVICFKNAFEGIQDRNCYSEVQSWNIYGSVTLVSESANSTICTNSNSFTPFLRCTTELTSFFNNHSFLYRTGREGCYSIDPIPSKEDNNCFFSGSSCSGLYPVLHQSNNDNCVLTKFNLVNNTDSSGYFSLGYGSHKRVKESVIVFKSTDALRWISYNPFSATLSIEGSFVIASGAIDGGGKVTLTSGTIITTASQPTHTPFHSHPQHSQCGYFILKSQHFSISPEFFLNSLNSFLIFVPILIR